jgi:2-desacetyl-2-hydroxyethyl bacteriochlorophyllide A dehydrogenase
VREGNRFGFESIEVPRLAAGDVLISIEAAGICAADRKIYSGDHPWQLPDLYVPGHEYVGRVTALGPDDHENSGLELGDRITAEIIVPCRSCWFCHRGIYHLCDNPGICVGAWAEYLRVPSGAIVHRIPNDLSPEVAALVEPLACSIHGVQLARIGFSDAVVIAGMGAIGMGMLQAARLKSPQLLIGLDVDDGLLDLAMQLGADHVFNPSRDDLGTAIRDLTEGRGCDVYIEVSGSTRSIRTGFELVRKAGRVVIFGVYGQPATLDLNVISEFKELEIIGGHLSPNTYPLAIRYLSEGLIDGEAMATHVFPLSDFAQAIEAKAKSDVPSIKTILLP